MDFTVLMLILQQVNRTQWDIMGRIALDYLPIQGSSVPSERAFSSAAITDDPRRNTLSPDMFEALQLVKKAYNTDQLDPEVEAAKHAPKQWTSST